MAGSALLLILVAAVGARLLWESDGGLVKNPNIPREYWPQEITTQQSGSVRTVTNEYAGYEITVPSQWLVTGHAATDGLFIAFDDEVLTEIPIESGRSGGSLSIVVIPIEEPLTLDQWLSRYGRDYVTNEADIALLTKTSFPGRPYEVVELSRTLVDAWEEDRKSALTMFFVHDGSSQIFRISCVVAEEDFVALHHECVQYAKTFRIL